MRTIKCPISRQQITYDEEKYLDLKGNIVKRNPVEYPYSYNPYVIYKADDYKESDLPYYNDRVIDSYYTSQEIDNALSQMGLKRYGAHWERLSWTNPEQIGRFMSILMKKNVICTAIMQGCNYGNGNPYWLVYIR